MNNDLKFGPQGLGVSNSKESVIATWGDCWRRSRLDGVTILAKELCMYVGMNITTKCGFVERNWTVAPDWRIYKENLDVQDSITRNQFPAGIFLSCGADCHI